MHIANHTIVFRQKRERISTCCYTLLITDERGINWKESHCRKMAKEKKKPNIVIIQQRQHTKKTEFKPFFKGILDVI